MIPGRPLHADTQRHVRRMAVHNDLHIRDLDLLIRGLHDKGIWNLLTTLNVAGPSSTDTLLDIKGNQDSVLIGAPLFVADRGFTTIGVTDIINTQVLLNDTYENDISLAVYRRLSSGHTLMGENFSGGAPVVIYVGGGPALFSSIQAFISPYISVSGGGFCMGSRTSADDVHAGGDMAIASSVASVFSLLGATHYPISVGCNNSVGTYEDASPNQYAHWSVGRGMLPQKMLAYNLLIKEYFTRRGTAV